jgi:succinate-semialdehyde dehydrogenase/glutarate-semialdehyde dehydrogenase
MNTPALQHPALFQTRSYIDGAWLDSPSTYAVSNPATGACIAQVARAGAAETQAAIDAASRAMVGWRARTAKERGAILRRWSDLMLQHREDLALI